MLFTEESKSSLFTDGTQNALWLQNL
uniref:Structural maintenance of chromosomes protein 3 isoform X3 n=1 Tax=Rhizophora mucronata TaxID=61149 RepID=A0A2P2MIA9_RHIMU